MLRLTGTLSPVFTLLLASTLASAALTNDPYARPGLRKFAKIQEESRARFMDLMSPPTVNTGSVFVKTAGNSTDGGSVNGTSTFSNPAADQFHVDGSKIPDVGFDAGDSWAGLLPISADPDESRKLFFWFWPTTNPANADKLIFWTNGPGCSSMEGFLQENGPISWSWGQNIATPNKWSWTQLANVVWVEQPVGTGFSQGKPNITNDDELASQAAGFMTQFLDVFEELKGAEFYITGESYAGFYVPYIANWIYEHPGVVDLDLKGIWIADPSLSHDVVQQQIPALRFAQANKNVFPFDKNTTDKLQQMSDACGYTDYLEKNLQYPPQGQLPFPSGTPDGEVGDDCDILSAIIREVSALNPAFDIYRVTETYPAPFSVLGFPEESQGPVYFNRTDVQDAIHAPHIEWALCGTDDSPSVYVDQDGNPGRDTSIPSTLSVLPSVIEKSERALIIHGLADMILIAEGTRIAIQNMTWGGAQGFQTEIESDNFIVDKMGPYGHVHQERNLTYVEFQFSGHMTPQFVPWAAYQTIQYLVGDIDSPSIPGSA